MRRDSGQAVLEYILMLAISMALVAIFVRGVSSTLDQGILSFGGQLEKQLKTGRLAPNVWTN